MAFDFRIAAKRDPVEASVSAQKDAAAVGPQAASVSLAVTGPFGKAGCAELMRLVKQSFDDGADTVVIDVQDVVLEDNACLERFADSLMAERSAGRHVQVVARQPGFYAACAALAGSRDWLIAFTAADVSGGRRSVHVDGARKPP